MTEITVTIHKSGRDILTQGEGRGIDRDAISKILGLTIPRTGTSYTVRYKLDPKGELMLLGDCFLWSSVTRDEYPVCIFPAEWRGLRLTREIVKE